MRLLERDGELEALARALEAASRGTGAAVLVEGPAGIGKTDLLAATADRARELGLDVLAARGRELEGEAPFGVAIELLAPVATPASPPTGAGDLHSLVRALHAATVQHLAAAESPALAILVDDAQWCDRPSLAFVVHLAGRLADLPVALVVAARSGEPAVGAEALAALRGAPDVRRLVPAPLSDTAVATLVERELGAAAPELTAACARASAGNPFLARELARALRAEGVAPTAHAAAAVADMVPDSVLRALLNRLARLGSDAGAIAKAVAVLGDRAPLRLAIALADLDARAGEDAADTLVDAQLLAPVEPLRFAHPLIAGAVRRDIAPFARARAHRRAATLLADDGAPIADVAAHLLHARPAGDPWTVDRLRAAADHAVAHGDPQAASRLLRRALDEPPPPAQRLDILLGLAQADALHGDTEAERWAREALDLAADPAQRAGALRAISRVHMAAGEHVAAAAAVRELLAEADPDDPQTETLLAEYLTLGLFRAPLNPDARERTAELLRRRPPPRDAGLLAHITLRHALDGSSARVVRASSDAAVAAGAIGDLASFGLVAGLLVEALCCVDELVEAERIADAALRFATARGALVAAATGAFHRALARSHRGALGGALADVDLAQAPSRDGWDGGSAWSRALEARLRLERGDLEAARAAVAFGPPPADWMDEAILRAARADVALADGDHLAAREDALAAGARLADAFGIDHPGLIAWRGTAARAARAAGRTEEARRLAAEELTLARRLGIGRPIGQALRTVAATGTGEARIGALREAVAVLRAGPAALARTHAIAELGMALRAAGEREEARALLREALQEADRMGATALAKTARAELVATGARPRRPASTGAGALTPAERRVADLAASGLTNAEIARALFVTPRTVQTHLAHTYRKLGIASRRLLADALEP